MPLPADIGALGGALPRPAAAIQACRRAPASARGRWTRGVRRRAPSTRCASSSRRSPRPQPLVLCIDDAQWGDVDSAGAPRWISSVRPLAAPCCSPDVPRRGRGHEPVPGRGARALAGAAPSSATSLIGHSAPTTRRLWRSAPGRPAARRDGRGHGGPIARESRGSPFLVEELVREHRAGLARDGVDAVAPPSASGAVRLETVVTARMATLADDARRLIELVAVSARPLPVAIVGRCGGGLRELDETIAASAPGASCARASATAARSSR